ncbi:MAG: hypothetical protein WAM04_09990 [Candidatus Sulfotelmatobacter sp.]
MTDEMKEPPARAKAVAASRPNLDELIHEADLAKQLRLTVRTVAKHAKRHRLRRVIYYRRDDVMDFLSRGWRR